jgi:hypothetical protein
MTANWPFCPQCLSTDLIESTDPVTGDAWIRCLECGNEWPADE